MQDGLTRVHSSVCYERRRDSICKAEMFLKKYQEGALPCNKVGVLQPDCLDLHPNMSVLITHGTLSQLLNL